jgi:SAM-dependent methyltransferase
MDWLTLSIDIYTYPIKAVKLLPTAPFLQLFAMRCSKVYKYDEDFYTYINDGSRKSAQGILPALLDVLPFPVRSVMDAGCGAGAWLGVWKSLGAEVLGLDGSYISNEQLLIDQDEFIATDLAAGFQLDRSFDLVQSLEVAEHLPETVAKTFVESLCRHSSFVLFSAATPGQGGENHLNEQSFTYWRRLFGACGYLMYDPIRREVIQNKKVMSWYRYNTFLYVSENVSEEVLTALEAYRVGTNENPVDLSPLSYQIRRRLIQTLPPWASTKLAILKKSLSGVARRIKGAWA